MTAPLTTKKFHPFLFAAGAWCLVLTFIVFRNYSVYQLSRWGICASAIYGASVLPGFWRAAMVIVAILFNPIAPLHLGRDTWKVVDAIAAAVFFIGSFIKTASAK